MKDETTIIIFSPCRQANAKIRINAVKHTDSGPQNPFELWT